MSEDRNEPGPTELPSTEAAAPSSDEQEWIGPYRLVEKIGEGGMGQVWLAEQTEPVKRKVALKVIKQGMDTKQVVARFEAERQALAMMDHPAIAKIFDAGATPRGRPYFVMEYVKGVPITEHCDRHKLTNKERLDLFLQVCDGVQHAHHKAVIHRDLKPGNVLVSIRDDKPVPKVIDFGVAKATAQKLTEKTMHTQLGVMIGTPAYMSPEQAEMTGQDIDTRTDVYSLGVMLYELLVGAPPFDPKALLKDGYEAMVRRIREVDPSRPSTRLSTLGDQSTQSAERRRTELPALRRELSGDLDWITMKALEKDRTRRYSSPHELGADIERYLTHQPVLARPPSASYRAKKFVRRNTLAVSATAAGLLLLTGFAAMMAIQARRIAAERDVAQQAQADLETVVEFQTGIKDLEVRSRVLGDDHLDTLRAMNRLGLLYIDQARWAEAERLLLEGLEGARRVLGDDHPDTIGLQTNLAITYSGQGRYDEAELLYLESVEAQRRAFGDDHPGIVFPLYNLACLDALRGDREGALDWLRQSVDAGWKEADWMAGDADLESLHGIEFDALVEHARQNAVVVQAEGAE